MKLTSACPSARVDGVLKVRSVTGREGAPWHSQLIAGVRQTLGKVAHSAILDA